MSCKNFRATFPRREKYINYVHALFQDAVQSDLRMCTKEPSFCLQTVYLGIGSPDMYVHFIVVSESEIALNTRAWKLSRSRDARVGIVITMIHRIYILL